MQNAKIDDALLLGCYATMDTMTPEQRHRCMSRIHGRDTLPEIRVRKRLFAEGWRFRVCDRRFPGRPDVVLLRKTNAPGWTDYGREATEMENLSFSEIRMNGIYGRPVLAAIAPTEKGVLAKSARDIRFSNVHATGLELPFLTDRPDCPLTGWTFTDCSFRQVAEEALPDWRHHGAASWDRKDGQGFVMRHAAGFKFNNTEIDAL